MANQEGALNRPPDTEINRGGRLDVNHLSAWYGGFKAVDDVSLAIEPKSVTAIIGPSGCGKTTFIRTLNRMHEMEPGASVSAEAEVLLDGEDIYASGVDPVAVKRRVGMVFQRPNPFPTMTIEENVVAGLTLNGIRLKRGEKLEVVEHNLRRVGLWDAVKDRLRKPAIGLSGGQQQRLSIARAIAINPKVLLMDEPCSALDPKATFRIEQLIAELKEETTIVIVTHRMEQAARISDTTAFFNVNGAGVPGRLVEVGPTSKIFTNPDDDRTMAYVTGRFG
jgi:phosphate transport system ATP-binding protein